MGRLLKYEIRGSYKIFLIVFASMILLSSFILLRIDPSDIIGRVIPIVLVDVGTFIAILVIIIGLFNKEMYEDKGYLTFTLPIRGRSILGAKLISSLLWFMIASILAVIFLYFVPTEDLRTLIIQKYSVYFNWKIIAVDGILNLFNVLFLLTMIFFSITISKITFKNKKAGKFIGFVTFVIINSIFSFTSLRLMWAFPQEINIGFTKIDELLILEGSRLTMHLPVINIAVAVFSMLFLVSLLWATSYLIDNKIEI